MAFSLISCSYCNKKFSKDNRHTNENLRLGHKSYCSVKCQSLFKNKRLIFHCQNPDCKKEFIKRRCEISKNNYCSRSCAARVNNVKFPKRIAVIRKCGYCKERFFGRRKYCSTKCKSDALTLSKGELIHRIRKFYKESGRIPVKREMNGIYKPARKYFGNWNNAVEAAGFKPNPILFADRCIAKDGHICDSLAEKLIDDYLFDKNIQHERCVSYPESNCTADFKIGSIFVEYFGLVGEHKRYDELRKIKQQLAKKYKLDLIEIYPKDLYPHNRLEAILGLDLWEIFGYK